MPRKKARVVPGRTRVGGYYGRYSTASSSELKFFDTTINVAPTPSAGTISPSLNLIPQGVTESQRVGRKCVITKLQARIYLELIESNAIVNPPNNDQFRIIIFLDKQANGAAVGNVTDLLETASTRSFRNLSETGRFKFLYDKVHTLNRQSLASDAAGQYSSAGMDRYITIFKKCHIPLEFSSTTGAITEIRSNNIGVLWLPLGNNLCNIFSTFSVRS
jgi:hypothetical protein